MNAAEYEAERDEISSAGILAELDAMAEYTFFCESRPEYFQHRFEPLPGADPEVERAWVRRNKTLDAIHDHYDASIANLNRRAAE